MQTKRPKIKVTCLGHGGAFAPKEIGNTAFLIEYDHHKILVDCGTTVPEVLKDMGVDPGDLTACYITHLHGDHVGGLERLLYHRAYISKSAFPLQLAMGDAVRADWLASTQVLKNDLRRHVLTCAGAGLDDVRVTTKWFETNHGGDIADMSCYSFTLQIEDVTLFFSGDRIWHEPNSKAIRAAMMCADLAFHEIELCMPGSGAHTNICDLIGNDIRPHIWWVHHGINSATPQNRDGLLLAVKGQTWAL